MQNVRELALKEKTKGNVLMSSSTTYSSVSQGQGSGAAESVASIATVVLTILGLAHVEPPFLVAIAAITLGIASIAQGISLVHHYSEALTASGSGSNLIVAAGSGAWVLSLFTGAAGVILGILALLSVAPIVLVAIAAVALGGGLIVSSRPAAEISLARGTAQSSDEFVRRLVAQSASTATLAQGMAGLSGVVLGILALAGFSSLVLVLIALLVMGAFLLLTGSMSSSLIVGIIRR